MVFLFIIVTFFILLITSKIRIEINNFKFSTQKVNNSYINKKYNIKIQLVFLKVIPILGVNVNKEKIEKMKNKNRFQNINLGFKDIKIIIDKIIKKVRIKQIQLNLNVGTDSIPVTTTIIPIISTLVSILLQIKKVKRKEQSYKVMPVYNNGNLLNLQFLGIFEIKMIHIINIIRVLNKKRRVDKNERTSNRRAYDYSYEQH